MCVYERLIVFKRMHYAAYYFLVGTLAVIIQEAALRLLGESSFLLFRVLLTYFGLTVFTILPIYFSHRFKSMLRQTRTFLSPPTADDYEAWVRRMTDDFFSFRLRSPRIAVFALGAAALATFVLLPKPFSAVWPNIVYYAILLPVIVIGVHGCYFALAISRFLAQYVRFPMRVPFYNLQNDELKCIQGFYFETSLLLLFCVFYGIVLVRFSWYDVSTALVFWFSFASFWPLAMFVWSYWQVHVLISRMKQQFLGICSAKLQVAMETLDEAGTTDAVDRVVKLMDAQGKVERLPDWPVNVGSSITFVVTLVLPLASFVFDVFGLK